MKIAGIILAAGTSSRMGKVNKLTLSYGEHTIVEEVFLHMSASSVDTIIVVTGYEHERIEKLLSGHRDNRTRFIYNAAYRHGRATSIGQAIEQAESDSDAALFMVADKPQVNGILIERAITMFKEKQPAVLFVETPEGRGHPIIFAKRLYPDLMALEGDLVGNELISRYADDTIRLRDSASQIDIDNESDYHAVLNKVMRK
jgi:molybdenum cofactor cytidylyltransferase